MIEESDWSFEQIRRCDDNRAARLDFAGSPDDLIRSLAESLAAACDSGALSIAVDSKDNAFIEHRAIIQFRVEPELYDWFFNARTGYRAQFWVAPDDGMRFNEQIIIALRDVLAEHMPQTVSVRRIKVTTSGSREEIDCGAANFSLDELLSSLAPAASKIWICERLYDPAGGPVRDVGFATLSDAERSPAKLSVPRWADAVCPGATQSGEGLRAPWPSPECSWLDVKGGFLTTSRHPGQIKPQDERAYHIHSCGWT